MTTAELLRRAADALDESEDPFAGSFLRTNDVTADECMTLAEQLALGARIVAYAIEHPRSTHAQAMMLTMIAST